MNWRLFTWLTTILLLLSFVNAIGVYDNDGGFTYFISNPQPTINLTLQTTGDIVEVDVVELFINEDTYSLDLSERLNPGQTRTLSFNIINDFLVQDPLTTNDSVSMKVTVLDTTRKEVNVRGDPTEFSIELDTKNPIMLSPVAGQEFLIEEESVDLTFTFSEPIMYTAIRVDGDLKEELDVDEPEFSSYSAEHFFTFDSTDLEPGRNDISVVFEDLAGNRGTQDFVIFYRGIPLQTKLLTSEDDSDLEYYFSKEYPQLFNRTIFSQEQEFTLSVETSKQARCYYSSSLIDFAPLGEVTPKLEMGTSDNRTHSIIVNTVFEDQIWIGCQSPEYEADIAYLNDWMGYPNQLIKVRKNTGAELDIIEILPDSLVSTTPFDVDVLTSTKAACLYTFASFSGVIMQTENLVSHKATDIPAVNGNYDLTVTCLDVLNNRVTESQPIEIDITRGVRVTTYEPEYTDRSTATIRLTLSEDAECRYSTRQERVSDFDSLSTLNGDGLSRSFTTPTMVEGDNDFFIYCRKLNNVNMNKIEVTYDPKGPQIDNLTFLYDKEPTDYVGSTNEISFEFESESLTPIKDYHVRIDLPDSTFRDTISSSKATIKEDIEGATKLSIVAENELGRNSSVLSKTIRFDLAPPSLAIVVNGETVSITCIDSGSGCKNVYYGFSNTILDCNARNLYDDNDTITVQDYNYMCARGLDFVGNEGETQRTLITGFQIVTDDDDEAEVDDEAPPINFTFVGEVANGTRNETGEREVELEEEREEEDLEPLLPSATTNDEDNLPVILIIASAAALLIGLSGGAYYTYRKGYLDDQLEKMGIARAKPKSIDTSSSAYTTPVAPARTLSPEEKKSRYDDHLNKLNTFIDDTLDKRKNVFSSFKEKNRGKTKSYDDTLIKKKTASKKDSSFDEFYEKSSEPLKTTSSLEQEAEAFEKYHTTKSKDETEGKEIKKKRKSSK